MSVPRSAISVLRFGAGDLSLAIAAEDVRAVEFAHSGTRHIGEALGMEACAHIPGQRAIRVHAPGARPHEEVVFRADPPVSVTTCHASEILPIAPGISRDRLQPVMGFARIDDSMILLLDIPSVIRALAEQEEREVR